MSRYCVVPRGIFLEITVAIGDERSKDISPDIRKAINALLDPYPRSQKKPAWIVNDVVANAIFWSTKKLIIVEGQE